MHGGKFLYQLMLCHAAQDRTWKKIQVPCAWECQGYGQAVYTNFQYPFKCQPPVVCAKMNHVGSYQTQIVVPLAWSGRKVLLNFEGVSAAFYVWVDGQYVGYSQDARLDAEFDITTVVAGKLGKELALSLRVMRFCDGSYMEDQVKYLGFGRYVSAGALGFIDIFMHRLRLSFMWIRCPRRYAEDSFLAIASVPVSRRAHGKSWVYIPQHCSHESLAAVPDPVWQWMCD